jgi:hypothetical protein
MPHDLHKPFSALGMRAGFVLQKQRVVVQQSHVGGSAAGDDFSPKFAIGSGLRTLHTT